MIRQWTASISAQRIALVVLRTLIGWHFLYEGYFKLLRPAWSRSGTPLEPWSAAGYLRGATGPFAEMFHALGNAPWIGTLDVAIAAALVLVGLSLLVGVFVRAGCIGAFALLMLFYLSSIPLSGMPEPRAEGAYLVVNKNLIEAAAALVVFSFQNTERSLNRRNPNPRNPRNPRNPVLESV